MGMIWNAYRMDDERAQALARGLAAEEDAAFEALEEFEEGIDDAAPETASGEPTSSAGRMIDVDKAWHAIEHLYAAASTTSPISTGRVDGSEDVVVGLVPSARVTAIVAGMERITPALLRRGYDAKRFTREHVYPDIWDEEDVLDVYVMPYDAELREFYRAAAAAGEAVVWQLT